MPDDEDVSQAAEDDAAFTWLQAAVQELLDTPRSRPPDDRDTDTLTMAWTG
jgi:hypothetical protein